MNAEMKKCILKFKLKQTGNLLFMIN